VNLSDSERYELAYRRVWGALHRGDEPDLGQHERQLLHHLPREGGVALSWLARHLALPKSTTSVLLKDLERRGFVQRARDARDERRLAVVLTGEGHRRVQADTVLEPARLAQALERLPARRRASLLAGMDALAAAAEGLEPLS
jgi:DNA-binding MarR family transcriptional regulator